MNPLQLASVGLLALALAGCVTPPPAPPPPEPAPIGLAELMERPAERALIEGIRAYDEGQYVPAEAALRRSLAGGLRSHRDQATAHKLLAFVMCTSDRMKECELEFRAALRVDPAFTLGKSESGHPMWGPVFERARR